MENIIKRKKTLSMILLVSMILQMILVLIPTEVFAQPNTSVEVMVRMRGGGVVPNAGVRVYNSSGNPISFIKQNGVYKSGRSGYFNELVADNNGKILISGLASGSYNISLSSKDLGTDNKNIHIANDSDHQKVTLTVDKSNPETKEKMMLTFNSDNVPYKIVDANGRTKKFKYEDNAYHAGSGSSTIKSSSDTIVIFGLEEGRYSLIGQGKKYTLDFGGSRLNFTIDDKVVDNSDEDHNQVDTDDEEEDEEEIRNVGSVNINIINKQDMSSYKKSTIRIFNSNGDVVSFNKVDNKIVYSEDGEIEDMSFSGQGLVLNELPIGRYVIKDISNDGEPFKDTEFVIERMRETSLRIEKGLVKRDFDLRVFANIKDPETDKDVKEYVEGFKFKIYDENGSALKFKKNESAYEVDKDGSEEIEVSGKGVKIKNIPSNKITLISSSTPAEYHENKEKIEIDLIRNKTFEFQTSLIEYLLTIKGTEDEFIEGVLVAIKNSKGKQISKGMSDKEGVMKITRLVPDEDYSLEVLNVPSPYALPNKGVKYSSKVNNGKIIIDKNIEGDKTDKSTLIVPYAKFTAKTSSGQSGAIFSFIDKDGTEAYRLVSGEDGKISIPKLKHGEYMVSQLTAPDGYKVDKEKYELVVDGKYVSKEHSFENPKIGATDTDEEDTSSGLSKNIKRVLLFALTLIVVVFAYFFLVNLEYRKKTGKNKYKIFDKIGSYLYEEEVIDDKGFDIIDDNEDYSIDIDKGILFGTEDDMKNIDPKEINMDNVQRGPKLASKQRIAKGNSNDQDTEVMPEIDDKTMIIPDIKEEIDQVDASDHFDQIFKNAEDKDEDK